MAYEEMTYEYLVHRMMERVNDEYPNLDNREGSILFNAVASAAMELAIMYVELDIARSETFAETASREYLLKHCEQMGMDVSVFDATPGTFKGAFDVEVPIGSRWNCDLYNYEVTEYLGLEDTRHIYKMVCETAGIEPNSILGDLTPIDDTPNGLSYMKLIECVILGENETSDDYIRQAYYDYVNDTQIDGNVAQYEKWCREFRSKNGSSGIGNYKILPLWNGSNTVKVSILSAANGFATDELIDEFQEYLDPNTEGMGNGVAPIGAFVTVSTATEFPISVSADVTLQEGYSDTSKINDTIEKYFREISYKKRGNSYITSIPYMTLGAEILKTEGVAFINTLSINGGTKDITFGVEQIPTLGTTNWVVK